MSLKPQDVKKIAELSRFELSQTELANYANELSSIIGFIETMQEVDTSNVEPTLSVTQQNLRSRDDAVIHRDLSDELLSLAPSRFENYYSVPKVID